MSDVVEPSSPLEPRLERGCRIGLDIGTVRIGVARSDPDAILATPYETVRREEKADVRRIARIVEQTRAAVVYVGLPRTLSGGDSASTQLARRLAADIADAVGPVPVRLLDERLSTVGAARMMRASGRTAREQRSDIDAAAAVVILQTALDAERARNALAGESTGGTTDAEASAPLAAPRPRKPRHRGPRPSEAS